MSKERMNKKITQSEQIQRLRMANKNNQNRFAIKIVFDIQIVHLCMPCEN